LKHPVTKRLDYLIARHLYLLFPKLEKKTIKTSEEHDAELWVNVDEFVKIFQTAHRSMHMIASKPFGFSSNVVLTMM